MTTQLRDARPGPATNVPTRWLVEVGANPTGTPLLIFPHAGAGPNQYRRLGEAVLGRLRPFLVHLPGRETRLDDDPAHDIGAVVQSLARAVTPLLASRIAFYGHSMGALVAFELARQLRRAYGVEPDHLVVSGHAAPRLPRSQARHQLADDDLWTSVCSLRGTPPEVAADRQIRTMLLPVLRADFEVCETYRYRPEPALDCPISSFAGDHDQEAPPSTMAGWAAETRSAFQQETISGDHFFNLSDRGFAGRLLKAIG
jgi:medium-chain acyl-[acyl-carrier-protein] hydrolase